MRESRGNRCLYRSLAYIIPGTVFAPLSRVPCAYTYHEPWQPTMYSIYSVLCADPFDRYPLFLPLSSVPFSFCLFVYRLGSGHGRGDDQVGRHRRLGCERRGGLQLCLF